MLKSTWFHIEWGIWFRGKVIILKKKSICGEIILKTYSGILMEREHQDEGEGVVPRVGGSTMGEGEMIRYTSISVPLEV